MPEKVTSKSVPCTICGGQENEHGKGKSIHDYTQAYGDLRPRGAKAEGESPETGSRRITQLSSGLNENSAVARLLRVLVDKEILNAEDVLDIVLGSASEPPSANTYRDGVSRGRISGG